MTLYISTVNSHPIIWYNTDVTLKANGHWLGSQTGADGAAILASSFSGESSWLRLLWQCMSILIWHKFPRRHLPRVRLLHCRVIVLTPCDSPMWITRTHNILVISAFTLSQIIYLFYCSSYLLVLPLVSGHICCFHIFPMRRWNEKFAAGRYLSLLQS